MKSIDEICNEILEDSEPDFVPVFVHCEECNALTHVEPHAPAPTCRCWVCVEKQKLRDVPFWCGQNVRAV